MNGFPWLTLITFLPAFGAIVVAGMGSNENPSPRPSPLGGEREKRGRVLGISLAFSLAALGLTLLVCSRFDSGSSELQFVERHSWIPSLGVDYFLGIDGLGLISILLAGIVIPIAIMASREIAENAHIYFALMLLLQTGLYGAFTALNFFHWFIFWELSLIPAYFLIKLWGGADRTHAAAQFFIYTLVGSVTMLLSFLAIYYVSGTFDFIALAEKARSGELVSLFEVKIGWYHLTTKTLTFVIFAGVFLGFAIKVPLIPFHTWLPDAYAEAPTGTTIALTGAMSKMGVYGFLRILIPLFPQQMERILTPLLWLVIASIILSALAAFAQKDLKRILAYSSINHLGYCLLGVFAVMRSTALSVAPLVDKAAALNGVLLQMFNHGLTAATLFWFIAFLEERGRGLRGLDDFGGFVAANEIVH